MERVSTGIPGFDELIEGGFPKGFNVLLTGTPGAGKTIFGQQFLYNGAKEGHPGVYVSLDMSDAIFREQGYQFGWDIEKLESDNMLSVIKVPMDRKKVRLFDQISEEVKRINAERIVFDSLASFAINIDLFEIPLVYDEEVTKILSTSNLADRELFYTGNSSQRITFLALNHLAKFDTTNIIITDKIEGKNELTVDGVSEFVCDGLIEMGSEKIAKEVIRSIRIYKMRNTNNKLDSSSIDITSKGVIVKKEDVFVGSKVSGITPSQK